MVHGGGTVVLALKRDDQITVCDQEGLQRCELIVFDLDGECGGGPLGKSASGDASGLKTILGRGDVESERIASELKRHGARLTDIRSINVFGDESRAGDRASFDVAEDAICIVTAPGGPMRVDEQNPPSEIEVLIERSNKTESTETPLPEPLAEPQLCWSPRTMRPGAWP